MQPTQARKRSSRGRRERVHREHLQLDRVPQPEEVARIAERARRSWGVSSSSRLDIPRVCERLGIEVSVMAMDVPDGGAQGFLIPTTEGRFRIEVDPEPVGGWQSVTPKLRRTLARHRQRFLVAHELAHTLFYTVGSAAPERLVLDSEQQEAFCDDLARALLVPPPVADQTPFTPEGVIALQRRFDVSMEVALRSAVTTHNGNAWLLLLRSDGLRVQWTSEQRQITARALPGLRQLANAAARDGSAQTSLAGLPLTARAQYLPEREQVIVTAGANGPSRSVNRSWP